MQNKEVLFSELQLRNIVLPNRIIRSATYEGWGDLDGCPRQELADVYTELALCGTGTIITGFAFTSRTGRAMHPGQCGIHSDEMIEAWRRIVDTVKSTSANTRLVMQIAHAGRQTKRYRTGAPVVGASKRRCTYFKEAVHMLNEDEIQSIIGEFADAALRASKAGFDAVQIHAAHGYLIHQFLSPWTNTRNDKWADHALFLEEIIHAVRAKCGDKFPILVKLSAEDDSLPGIRIDQTIKTVERLERLGVDAVEISYGTMEYALNIIRGSVPIDTVLAVNPMFNQFPEIAKRLWKRFCLPGYKRHFIPFDENYNLSAASRIAAESDVPIILVGGIRTLESMVDVIASRGMSAVSLCRPLICEPDLPMQIKDGLFARSKCTNCNLCTIYCDSQQPLRCYRKRGHSDSFEES